MNIMYLLTATREGAVFSLDFETLEEAQKVAIELQDEGYTSTSIQEIIIN